LKLAAGTALVATRPWDSERFALSYFRLRALLSLWNQLLWI